MYLINEIIITVEAGISEVDDDDWGKDETAEIVDLVVNVGKFLPDSLILLFFEQPTFFFR